MRAVLGCVASAIYFALLGVAVFAQMFAAPHCFSSLSKVCPADHDVNVHIMVTIVAGLIIYAAVGTALERRLRRRRPEDGQVTPFNARRRPD